MQGNQLLLVSHCPISLEFFEHFIVNIFIDQADDDCRNQAEQEARKDFVYIKDAAVERMPQDDRNCADNQTDQSTIAGCLFQNRAKRISGPMVEPNPAHA